MSAAELFGWLAAMVAWVIVIALAVRHVRNTQFDDDADGGTGL